MSQKVAPLLMGLRGPGSLGLARCYACGIDNVPMRAMEQHVCDPKRKRFFRKAAP